MHRIQEGGDSTAAGVADGVRWVRAAEDPQEDVVDLPEVARSGRVA